MDHIYGKMGVNQDWSSEQCISLAFMGHTFCNLFEENVGSTQVYRQHLRSENAPGSSSSYSWLHVRTRGLCRRRCTWVFGNAYTSSPFRNCILRLLCCYFSRHRIRTACFFVCVLMSQTKKHKALRFVFCFFPNTMLQFPVHRAKKGAYMQPTVHGDCLPKII